MSLKCNVWNVKALQKSHKNLRKQKKHKTKQINKKEKKKEKEK